MNERRRRRRNKSLRTTGLTTLVLLLVGSWLFARLAGPPIPWEITIYTGPTDSPFAEDGPRYAEILRRHGIGVRLVSTHGTMDNLGRLASGEGARVGFAESVLIQMFRTEQDATETGATDELVSLGSLYYEPLWVFARSADQVADERDLDGLFVYPGHRGSGTRVLAEQLLEMNGLDDVSLHEPAELLTKEAGIELFNQGEFDAVFIMGEPVSPAVDIRQRVRELPGESMASDESAALDRPGVPNKKRASDDAQVNERET